MDAVALENVAGERKISLQDWGWIRKEVAGSSDM
jgi:hypothetical protein